jgi:hypothetical protein
MRMMMENDIIRTSRGASMGKIGTADTDNLYYLTAADSEHLPCSESVAVCFWRASP